MTLGQSLFNALKGMKVFRYYFRVLIFVLESATSEALRGFQLDGRLKAFNNIEFNNFEILVFTCYVTRALREFFYDSLANIECEFLEHENNQGERVIRTWDSLVEWILRKLRDSGYSNIDQAFDDIVLAVMCLAYLYDRDVQGNAIIRRRIIATTFINILQLALEALSSVQQPEANAGEGSGEPQPEAEAHGEGSGEPQPEAEAHGEGSGEPQPEAEAHGEGSGEPQPEAEAHGEGSGEPQSEEGSADVPLDAGTVRGVRRYRLRDTPEREISRQRRARSRYNLRETPARRER